MVCEQQTLVVFGEYPGSCQPCCVSYRRPLVQLPIRSDIWQILHLRALPVLLRACGATFKAFGPVKNLITMYCSAFLTLIATHSPCTVWLARTNRNALTAVMDICCHGKAVWHLLTHLALFFRLDKAVSAAACLLNCPGWDGHLPCT